MSSPLKMTRQGVRDLDFGWKKKVVAPANADSSQAVASDDQVPPDAVAESGASKDPAAGIAPWSPPAVVASS